MLISSVHPETDLIYQCHTNLCVRVNKTRIGDFQEPASAAIYKHADKSVYIFEAVGTPDRDEENDIEAAIKWYLSYYHLGVQQEWR